MLLYEQHNKKESNSFISNLSILLKFLKDKIKYFEDKSYSKIILKNDISFYKSLKSLKSELTTLLDNEYYKILEMFRTNTLAHKLTFNPTEKYKFFSRFKSEKDFIAYDNYLDSLYNAIFKLYDVIYSRYRIKHKTRDNSKEYFEIGFNMINSAFLHDDN